MITALALFLLLATACSSEVPESDDIRQAIVTQDAVRHIGEEEEIVSELDPDAETTIPASTTESGEIKNETIKNETDVNLPVPEPLEKIPYKIPVGLENTIDSPLKNSTDRTLLRFVPKSDLDIDRFYFGFKLKGANCREAGSANFGKGDGGTIDADLVMIDDKTGLPSTVLAHETVNACTRYNQAFQELSSSAIPIMIWVNVKASLLFGKMYGLILRNSHADPINNFYSFNMPSTDTLLSGPHARNELKANADGALLGLDPREHVAYSKDRGKTWNYGSANGQYPAYLNLGDKNHPATRLPQYGYRLTNGRNLAGQPYYANGEDCVSCTSGFAKLPLKAQFTRLLAFTGTELSVGTLTIKNLKTGAEASCSPSLGYGKRSCDLTESFEVNAKEGYSVSASGAVDVMKMDYAQRALFPEVGLEGTLFSAYQIDPKAGSSVKDVPNIWAE